MKIRSRKPEMGIIVRIRSRFSHGSVLPDPLKGTLHLPPRGEATDTQSWPPQINPKWATLGYKQSIHCNLSIPTQSTAAGPAFG